MGANREVVGACCAPIGAVCAPVGAFCRVHLGHSRVPSKTKQGSVGTCQLFQAPANALTLSSEIPYHSVSSV